MSREATTLGRHPIEKGAQVVVAIRTLHRNEKLWPDSLGFDPDQPDISTRPRHGLPLIVSPA